MCKYKKIQLYILTKAVEFSYLEREEKQSQQEECMRGSSLRHPF